MVIEPQFDDALWFENGLAPARVGEQWGFIDSTGQFIIEPQFEDALGFEEGLAAVKTGGKYGFIDPAGQFAIAAVFDDLTGWRCGVGERRRRRVVPRCGVHTITQTEGVKEPHCEQYSPQFRIALFFKVFWGFCEHSRTKYGHISPHFFR